jgi:nitrite reductase (NADH) large subunit
MSTKLKLLGSDVASFGVNQPGPDDKDVSELVWNDSINGVYRKLIFNKAGTLLRGGILVGDASDYESLHRMSVKDPTVLTVSPAMLLAPPNARGGVIKEEAVSDDPTAQICSCNDVSRGDIANVVKELGVEGATLSAVKKCSQAGTGCGGCEPQVKDILKQELAKLGGSLSNHLCEHFAYSRPELMALVRTDPDITNVDSFEKILAKHGRRWLRDLQATVGSILSSLINENIMDGGRDLQETNDRSMANMQRGGTYSVVPRVPAGEISPNQLIVMGEVAKKYNLYTKVTGACK